MPDYDKTKPSTYIMYYDCNILYGGPIIQPLAVGDCQWEDGIRWNEQTIMGIYKTGERGYILEGDLEYSRSKTKFQVPAEK